MPLVFGGLVTVVKRAGKILRSLDDISTKLGSFDKRISDLETIVYKKAS